MVVNLLAVTAMLLFPFFKTRGRGIITISVITLQSLLSILLAILVFSNGAFEYTLPGSFVTGEINIRIDQLSAWFMLIISFSFITGGWYGLQYMKHYKSETSAITLHAVAFITVFTSLIDICIIRNSFVFLIFWELMALSSFILIIFDHTKRDTLKAGINFLIQSHISILFLTAGFIWMKIRTGTFDFDAIATFTSTQPAAIGTGLFVILFIGFAIKAGFVPFHTWLPLAHPAAPAHISGVMSGVIIKAGIYGILRMLLLIKADMVTAGYFIVSISAISGLYGVMLAIVQHNLKKLLAYHSIENIGIIGIGIGVGCLGVGYHNQVVAFFGFAGALLHTLNHSLFKSLLFYSAGNIYQAIHSMNIESMGGLMKKMPRSAWLFLVGSVAICGLPPFNGFVSEFLIYSGLFKGMVSGNFLSSIFMLFTALSLVLIGGLAILCFTKAFGIVFLGQSREDHSFDSDPEKSSRIIPMSFIALAIVIIGVMPALLMPALNQCAGLYQEGLIPVDATGIINAQETGTIDSAIGTISGIGWYSLIFIAVTALIFLIRHLLVSKREQRTDITWGCGYTGDSSRMQYTASSFVRTYRKLAGGVLDVKREKKEAEGLYPTDLEQHTHPGDTLERWLIEKPVISVRKFLNRFLFLQNGNIQAYILYGLIFIALTILIPLLSENIESFINLLKNL
ncbi:MAG: hypothetical protein M0P27_04540 [Bacteroidales bacterium]|nr:hypothetical protein [Bacteroidales bacterium]MDD4638513.1 proton-conducting transporter membrane subunit [Bacteroidales bacterium]